MKDHSRSLMIGIVLLAVSVIYVVMNSCKVAIFCGIIGVVWLGKAFFEWWKDKKQPS